MDRRREGDDQLEEDEKVQVKAANLHDPKAGKESISFKREDLVSMKEVVSISMSTIYQRRS
jgi:hypothetical protein